MRAPAVEQTPAGGAAVATLVVLGLAGALAVRVGLSGAVGAGHVGAAFVFGVLLLVVAGVAGQRWRRPEARHVLVGLLGGAVLCAPALAVHLGSRSAPLGWDGFAVWGVSAVFVGVAEEVVLRGALFDALGQTGGQVLAVAVSSTAFALLHVPLYGWAVVPLDLAVGVWLGGLRLATGGVLAPALAHSVGNLAGWWLR